MSLILIKKENTTIIYTQDIMIIIVRIIIMKLKNNSKSIIQISSIDYKQQYDIHIKTNYTIVNYKYEKYKWVSMA